MPKSKVVNCCLDAERMKEEDTRQELRGAGGEEKGGSKERRRGEGGGMAGT